MWFRRVTWQRPRGSLSQSHRRAKALRIGAAIASAMFHVAILLLIFGTASGDLVSAGNQASGATGPVFSVTLVRLASHASPDPTGDIRPILVKLRTASEGIAMPAAQAAQTNLLAGLSDRLRAEQPPPPRMTSQADTEVHENTSEKQYNFWDSQSVGHDGAQGGETGAKSTGDLWGAVEPCWRNLGGHSRVSVTLDIALNGAGQMRTPPKIIRSNSELIDDPRLKAEANAIAAVAACIPRGGAQFGGRTYRLEFPAAR